VRIVVLIKQVPVVSDLAFDPATRTLKREGVRSEVSAFDVRALVRALTLRDEHGGEVVVLTMGPPPAREALEFCLALGADRAVHLVSRYSSRIESRAWSHVRAISGSSSRRRAWPVGAVSTITRRRSSPSSGDAVRSVSSERATSSSRPGGVASNRRSTTARSRGASIPRAPPEPRVRPEKAVSTASR
jgi:hypothetical protein